MANEQDNDDDRVWKLAQKIRLCVLSTLEDGDIHGRPMVAHPDREENAIYFLSDAESFKDEDIKENPHVGLAFVDNDDQNYVSISGTAEVSDDRAKIEQLWSTPAKAWWDNPGDPSIRVLKFSPEQARYWDGPGTTASYIRLVKAAASGGAPAVGEQGAVRM